MMQAADLQLFASLVHARAGIVLGPDEAYLIESRFGWARSPRGSASRVLPASRQRSASRRTSRSCAR